MNNKKENFDEIEILDENLEAKPITSEDLIATDWLSDFTNVETKTLVQSQTEDIIEIMDEDIVIEEKDDADEKKTTEVLNSIEAVEPNNDTTFQKPPIQEADHVPEIDIEEELNNNRSVAFIATLFAILIIFILFLPTITKMMEQ